MQNPTRVVTNEVRLSYCHVFVPYLNPNVTQPGAKPMYSVMVLIPKSDAATKQRIDAAINTAISLGIKEKWAGVCPPQVPNPVHDGDGVRQDGTPYNPECKGHWVLTASQDPDKGKPEIVDAYNNPIISQSEVYSGCYGRVSLNFYPYNKNGKKGIGCGLGNIQKLRDGEPLDGKVAAANDFGAPPPGMPPAMPQQPAPGYQQAQAQTYQQQTYQQPAPVYQQPQPQTYQQPAPGGYPQQTYPQQNNGLPF